MRWRRKDRTEVKKGSDQGGRVFKGSTKKKALAGVLVGLFLVASPEACAEACLRFAEKGAEERYFPSFWWLIMAIIKAIPERLFKRLGI